jgi:hypothetical protein
MEESINKPSIKDKKTTRDHNFTAINNESKTIDDKLITEYQKHKPEIDARIKKSGLLPEISYADLRKDAKRGLSDLRDKLKFKETFMEQLHTSHSSNSVTNELESSKNFYKFSLASPEKQKELMKEPNYKPKESILEESSYHKRSSSHAASIYAERSQSEELSEITIPNVFAKSLATGSFDQKGVTKSADTTRSR